MIFQGSLMFDHSTSQRGEVSGACGGFARPRRTSAGRSACGRNVARGTSPSAGFSILEVLAVTFIVGITAIGVALMFGKGSAWVAGVGEDRVAAGLAQEWIEKVRARGWSAATNPGLAADG